MGKNPCDGTTAFTIFDHDAHGVAWRVEGSKGCGPGVVGICWIKFVDLRRPGFCGNEDILHCNATSGPASFVDRFPHSLADDLDLIFGHAVFNEVGFYDRNVFFKHLGFTGSGLADDSADDAGLVVAAAIGDGGCNRANLKWGGQGFTLTNGKLSQGGTGHDGTGMFSFPCVTSGKETLAFLGKENSALSTKSEKVEGIDHEL